MSDILFPFHSKFLTDDGEISRPWLMWLQNPQVLTISTVAPSGVTSGGTGLNTVPTNGQLLIGNGIGYSLGTLTATGMTVTNGAGTIALSLNTFSPSSYGGVPASGGGTSNFLRADATWAAPPAATPAGADTQVQYNSAGAFGANSNFAYTVGTNTLTIGTLTSPTGNLILTPFAPAAGTAPGALQITGSASQDSNNGGAVQIKSGTALTPSTGIGGLISLVAGGATSAAGGSFSMTGGSGTSGGGFTMLSGAGSSAASGSFTIGSGGGGFGSGSFSFGTSSGGAGGNSGNQTFTTGASSAVAGTTGTFSFKTGNQTNGGTSGSFKVAIGTGTTKGSIQLQATLGTNVIQITDNGTNQIGFFGATPVVKQTTGGTPTGAYTLNDVIASLQAYGLLV